MNRITFRADASPSIGGGHIYRCLTMARRLKAFGWDCHFECEELSRATIPALGQSGFPINNDITGGVEPTDILVVDHYELGRAYEEKQRTRAGAIFVIDDAPDREHDCDFLLDQTLGRRATDYGSLVPPNCTLLTGQDYALLGDEFLLERRVTHPREKFGSLLISLGATDPGNITSTVMDAVHQSGIDAAVMVILTKAMPAYKALSDKATHYGFEVLYDVTNMAELMGQSDLAIGAAGTMSWERCCVSLPALTLSVVDNQNTNAVALKKAGAVIDLGSVDDGLVDRISDALRSMSDQKLTELSHKAHQVVDGLGVQRALLALAGEGISEKGPCVSLRCARLADMEKVFQWQQIRDIRAHSRHQNAPTWDEHRAWYTSMMNTPQNIFSLILADGEPCGSLRLSARPGRHQAPAFEISIMVIPEFQAVGIARLALHLIRQACPGADFWAFVKSANAASMRLFAKCGYVPEEADWYLSKAPTTPGLAGEA